MCIFKLRGISSSIFAFLCLLATPSWAQVDRAAITGTLHDGSGAVVTEARVTLSFPATGLKRSTLSNGSGAFLIAGLPVGHVQVQAEKQGFRTSEQAGVVLDAATRRNLDFRMELGAITESVSVSAAVEQVQTASGDATRVISDRQLSQVALNGRNYSQLLRLIPGAVATTLDPFGLALSTTGHRRRSSGESSWPSRPA